MSEYRIRLNLDSREYRAKPIEEYGLIRNRLCQAGRIREITLEQLAAAVEHGVTFTAGEMTGTSNKDWQGQQLCFADIDNTTEDKKPLANPLQPAEARALLARHGIDPAIMYHTFSSTDSLPRFRIVLALAEAVTDSDTITDLTSRLAYLLNTARPGCADDGIGDPARFFAGSRPGSVFYRSDSITSLDTLRSLPARPAPEPAPAKPRQPRSTTPARPGTVTFDDAIDRIRAEIDCRDYLEPSKSGNYVCPFCDSGTGPHRTGALRYYPNTNRVTCFKCGSRGGGKYETHDVIDIHMKTRGVDFVTAVKDLARELNLTIDTGTGDTWRRRSAAEDFSGALAWNDTIDDAEGPQAGGSLSFNGAGTPQAAPATGATQAATEAAQAIEQPRADFADYLRRCIADLAESDTAQNYLADKGISMDTATACNVGFDAAWTAPGGSDPQPCLIVPASTRYYTACGMADHKAHGTGDLAIMGGNVLYTAAEAVFIVPTVLDALSIIEAGQPAISLNRPQGIDLLIKQLEQQPTGATLILCFAGSDADRLKAALNRLNVLHITANLTGGQRSINAALTADRAAFEQAIEKALAETAAKPDNTATYLDDLMAGEIERFKQAEDRQTGFSNLDEKAGGLYSGLYVLAAISSLGKTTLALQMADQMAAAGQDVLFFSMEQSRLEMVSKSLARITAQANLKTAVNSLAIRKGYLPPQVLAAVKQYREQTGDRLSIIEGNFNCDIGYIADYIRRYKQRTGTAPVVFIDYLQILQPAADGKSRGSKKDEIDLAVTELKRLSRELDLTIIVISSLNRANYLTPFAFESLKESGSIEYTADVVWGLQLACLDEPIFGKESGIKEKRERVNQAKAENPRQIKFICLKNRYGISNYDCLFNYYPANDLFLPAAAPAAATAGKGAAKRI